MYWPSVQLKEIGGVKGGFAFKSSDFVDEGIPLIRIGDIDNQEVAFDKAACLPCDFLNKYEKFLLQDQDTLIALTGATTGKTGVLQSKLPCLLNQRVGKFYVKNKSLVDYRWIKYWVRTSWVQGQIWELAHGGAQPNISPNQIEGLEIPFPPIAEQRRIVEILDQADALRKKRAEADKIAERSLPALFIKMFGDPASNPHDLDVVDLGELIEGPQNGLYKHASFYGEGTPILRIDSFYEGVVDTSKEFRRLRLTDEEIAKYALKENDVVINRVNGSRELFGKSALVPKLPEKTVFESNMMRFSVDLEKLDPVFTIQQLQTPAIRQQMIGRSKHINQYSVNQGDIRSLKILLPNLQLQKTFANRITSLQSLMKQQRIGQVNLETLFQTLLHRAFSGELTAEWRKAHMQELLQEMEHQAKVLGIEHKLEYEQLGMFE